MPKMMLSMVVVGGCLDSTKIKLISAQPSWHYVKMGWAELVKSTTASLAWSIFLIFFSYISYCHQKTHNIRGNFLCLDQWLPITLRRSPITYNIICHWLWSLRKQAWEAISSGIVWTMTIMYFIIYLKLDLFGPHHYWGHVSKCLWCLLINLSNFCFLVCLEL